MNKLDRLFDRIFTSKYNPLYRSGTIAVCLLIIVIVTGCFLLFYYRLSAPFESMLEINANAFASAIRSLHRYASDLCVVVVVFHVLRMLTEKKTWGPRLLAWVSGVGLTLILFIVGWTGFILMWDTQAQELAKAGSDMLEVIPFFKGTLSRAISGATTVGASFFFLNLFLHMSLPLGMLFLLWLHTSKLNRPKWLLEKKYFLFFIGALTLFSVLKPAYLAGPANLLNLDNQFSLNWFYAFVIPMVKTLGPAGSLSVMLGFFILMISIPWWLRPKKENQPLVSVHNPNACTGCGQCASDCPFSAIDMIPRTTGQGSETVAFVDTTSCVGCGICTASCTQMAIGPEDKSSRLQMKNIKELKSLYSREATLCVYCDKNELGPAYLAWQRNKSETAPYPITCTGNFHVASAVFALGHFQKVLIVGCSEHACINRLGQKLLEERFLHGREPLPPGKMDMNRVEVISGNISDFDKLKKGKKSPRTLTFSMAGLASTAMMLGVWFLGAMPFKIENQQSVLRLAIRFPSQVTKVCKDKSEEELSKMPLHMRSAQNCVRESIDYDLVVTVDGETKLQKVLSAGGIHGDKPMKIEEDLVVAEGNHLVKVNVLPKVNDEAALKLGFESQEQFEKGKILLLYFNNDQKALKATRKPL